MHYTTIDPKKSKIGTHDHALHHHWWPLKVKYSNPRPCTTPPLTQKSQRFEPTTMHYTTIDPQKTKIRTQDHALHHHWWSQKRQRFEPKTMHYTTIDDPRKDKDSNPRPCTTPPLMIPEKTKIRTHDMHYSTIDSPKVKDSNQRPCATPLLTPKRKIQTHDHALHHHWHPKSQRFEPTTMYYTTIDPQRWTIRTHDMHFTTIDPTKSKIRTHDTPPLMSPKRQRF
jgi:hypothetical protein